MTRLLPLKTLSFMAKKIFNNYSSGVGFVGLIIVAAVSMALGVLLTFKLQIHSYEDLQQIATDAIVGVKQLRLRVDKDKQAVSNVAGTNSSKTFHSQKECEDATKQGCKFQQCDYETDNKCLSDPTGWVPKVSSQTSDIATWKTYRNEKYGFEFKYPDRFSADTCGTNKNSVFLGGSCGSDKLATFTLAVESDHKVPDLTASYENTLKSGTGFRKVLLIIAGSNATELSVERKPQQFSYAYTTYIIFSKNGINFVAGSDENNLVNQILSTFKFTK